jgi:hypothetical protein
MNLGTGTVRGNLSASTIDKAITQSGALSVAGSTTISAGTGAITLTDAGNSFQGPIAISGGSVQIGGTLAAGTGQISLQSSGTSARPGQPDGGNPDRQRHRQHDAQPEQQQHRCARPISTGGDFALTTTRSLGQSGAGGRWRYHDQCGNERHLADQRQQFVRWRGKPDRWHRR